MIGDDDSDSGDDGVAVQDEMAPIYLRSATFIHRQSTVFWNLLRNSRLRFVGLLVDRRVTPKILRRGWHKARARSGKQTLRHHLHTLNKFLAECRPRFAWGLLQLELQHR